MNHKIRLTQEILEAIATMADKYEKTDIKELFGHDTEYFRQIRLKCIRAGYWAKQELYKRGYNRGKVVKERLLNDKP